MSWTQGLLLAALVVAAVALLRAIRDTLFELEPAAFARPLPLPLLHPLLVLIAHYADRRLRVPWRATQRSRLLAAGFGERPTPPEWFALRCLAGALALTLTVALALVADFQRATPLIGLATAPAAWFGYLAPEWWLRQRMRRRMRAIESHLGLHLEMLLAGLEAGLAWHAALRCAVQSGPEGALGQAMALASAEKPAGCDAAEDLRRIDLRLQSPAAHRILGEIVRAYVSGTGLRRALHGALDREAARRFAQAEFSARWAPRDLLRPLLVGALPGVALMLILLRPP
jgi:tight adherence protein C